MLSALVALTTIVIAGQTPGGPIRDTRPWNPANWDVEYQTIYDGTDSQTHWVIDQSTGQPKEETVARDWEDTLAPPIPPAAINSTNTPRTVRMSSTGTIKKRIKWVGVGDPPGKVLVKLDATASSFYKLTGTATAANGIGDAAISFQESGGTECQSIGSVIRNLSVGSNGIAEVDVTLSSFAESTGVEAYAKANAKGLLISIAERNVYIEPWLKPTYTINPTDATPMPIVNDDPLHIILNTAAHKYLVSPYLPPADSFAFRIDPSYNAVSWGPWNQPLGLWHNGDQAGGTIDHFIYTPWQMLNIATRGPQVKDIWVRLSDQDGVTREAHLELRIHAPAMDITTVSDEKVYGAWKRCSTEEDLRPGEGQLNLAVSMTTVEGITRKVTNTIGGDIGGDVLAVLKLKLAYSYAWGEDETASLAKMMQASRIIGPVTVPTKFWIERRGFWMERWGWDHVYGESGYQGTDVWCQNFWCSGSVEEAERLDAEDRLQNMVLPL